MRLLYPPFFLLAMNAQIFFADSADLPLFIWVSSQPLKREPSFGLKRPLFLPDFTVPAIQKMERK